MVMVSVSETYDIQTKVNKMTLIGIHTPKKSLIQKTYPGLAMNCKYWRIDHVDVDIAAVSTLPLSPEQVGFDTGDVAPQDMLNPILYKACSNDSWSTLEARLNGLMTQASLPSPYVAPTFSGNMAECEDDSVTTLTDEHGVYYSLLSDHDGFRIAGVQQGLSMHGLVPLVFEALYSHGESGATVGGDSAPGIVEGADGLVNYGIQAYRMRGHARPMPRINTTYLTGVEPVKEAAVENTNYVRNGMGDGTPANFQKEMPDVPPIMLGCVVMPPMTNTPMWFRMVVRAFIEFTDVRPITEIASFYGMSTQYAPEVYHSNYATLSRNMEQKTDMVDGRGVEKIDKIMEGA